MTFCFISLGSNIVPEENFRLMLGALHALSPRLAVSRVIRTEPVGMPSSAQFLNGVVRLQTRLTPAALKEALVAIELRLGRDRDDPLSKAKDRVADLDILFCLPEEANIISAESLPSESYVRPLLLELLATLGYQVEAAMVEPPAGHPLQFAGQTIGRAPSSSISLKMSDDKP